MKIRTALAALALALTPGLAFAFCGDHVKSSASNCAADQVWDGARAACVDKPTT